MRWPWEWAKNGHDTIEVDEAESRTVELEDRAEQVADRLREQDPWAGRVLDAIHHPRGEPHAR